MKKFVNVIIILILLVSSIFNVVLVNRLDKSIDAIVETKLSSYETVDTVFFNSVVFDTVFLEKFDSVRLTKCQTDTVVINDSILVFDSVDVILPINKYVFDTILNQTHINLICNGFDVRLNSLLVENLKTAIIKENKPKKWYNNFGFGVGLGVTYIDRCRVIPTVGIYYKLF